jgi:hypothetical protein
MMKPHTTHPNTTVLNAFEALLSRPGTKESHLQVFLEEHPEFLLTPFLLNHGLHFDAVISKLPLGHGLITDFAYLTKSSTMWRLVLVELEKHDVAFFKADHRTLVPTAEFTARVAQIDSWRDAIGRYKDEILRRLDPIRRPLGRNYVEVCYFLIVGRSPREHTNQRVLDRLARMGGADVQISTYDSLLRHYESGRAQSKNVLAVEKDGFKFKQLHCPPHQLLQYLSPHELFLRRAEINKLTRWGLQVDKWTDDPPFVGDVRTVT